MLGQLLSIAVSSSLSQLWLPASTSSHPKRWLSCIWQGSSQQCRTRLAARPATKTQHQSLRLALLLSAMEATLWCLLGFQVEDDSQDQRGAEQISQIDDAADCAGSLDLTCMKCDKRVSVAEHLHNLSPFSLHSMIEVSAEAWHAMLISYHALAVLLWYLSRLGIRWGLACYSISCHARALAVSAEAWHAILYLVTPWQYLLRLGIHLYSLSRLGSICLGYSISYHASGLAVSA